MTNIPMMEGKVSFNVPKAGKPCSTYYKVVGDLNSGKTPIIALHGGSGAGHEYLLGLTDLTEKLSIPTVFYDQIGTGQSTHLPEKNSDGFDLIGQSWGGMMGSTYAAKTPKGLRRLVLASAPASIELYTESQNRLVSRLPQDVQDVMDKCERSSPEYMEAVTQFYQKHLCQVKPWPAPEVLVGLNWMMGADPTVFDTLWGLSALTATGTLKTWSVIDQIPQIKASTLLINGVDDEAQDSCIEPFFKLLPKVKWVIIQNASHFPHVEQREQFMKLVGDFLEI